MKFAKIAAVASVAAMSASGAFATTANADLAAALAEIEAAYTAFEADAGTDVTNALDSILYMADNHGAVKNVDFNALTADADGEFTVPDLTVELFDFSAGGVDGDITTAVSTLRAEVNTDFFGDSSSDFAQTTLSTVGGDWVVGGTTGHVADYIARENGLLADLNAIQDAVDVTHFDAAAIDVVTGASSDLDAEVLVFNSAVEALNSSEAENWEADVTTYAYADREGATDKVLNGAAVTSAVDAAAYSTIVDAYIN